MLEGGRLLSQCYVRNNSNNNTVYYFSFSTFTGKKWRSLVIGLWHAPLRLFANNWIPLSIWSSNPFWKSVNLKMRKHYRKILVSTWHMGLPSWIILSWIWKWGFRFEQIFKLGLILNQTRTNSESDRKCRLQNSNLRSNLIFKFEFEFDQSRPSNLA